MQDKQWFEIVDIITQLWDKWEFTNAEIEIWRDRLKHYDFRAVKNAVSEFYASESNTRNKPTLSKIVSLSFEKNKLFSEAETTSRIEPDFMLIKADNEGHFKINSEFCMFIRDTSGRDKADIAESQKKRFERMYGGQWVVVRLWDIPVIPKTTQRITLEEKLKILERQASAGNIYAQVLLQKKRVKNAS